MASRSLVQCQLPTKLQAADGPSAFLMNPTRKRTPSNTQPSCFDRCSNIIRFLVLVVCTCPLSLVLRRSACLASASRVTIACGSVNTAGADSTQSLVPLCIISGSSLYTALAPIFDSSAPHSAGESLSRLLRSTRSTTAHTRKVFFRLLAWLSVRLTV